MSDMLKAVKDAGPQAVVAAREFSAKMPGTPLTQALAVGALAGVVTYRLMKKRYRLPPGPRPLPLLGNLLWMNSKEEQFYVMLDRWAKETYGPVIAVYMGPVLCITLNDLDTVTEALVQKGKDFAGRPMFCSWEMMTEGYKDIAFADPTPAFKLHRKIAMQAIRHYMTGSNLEQVVHTVMGKMMEKMAAEPGPFDPSPYNSTLMFHIIGCICFGEVKPYDDPGIHRLVQLFDKFYEEMGNGLYEDIVPLLKYFPTRAYRNVTSMTYEMLDYFEEKIQQHRQSFSADKVRDVTDSILLAQMEAAREESAEVMAMFTDAHVRQTISDLFSAGVDTSRETLDWVMLYMAGHPEIQKRAQAEIDAASGTGMPGLGHKDKLQYTQAALYEVMRLEPVAPTALPHKAMCDTTIGGFDVPKDTMVMPNMWAVMRDPRYWDQPYKFMPERFLDDKGKLKPMPKAWMPFSAGRRMCLGESVAKPELLLLVACFLKRFTISLPDGVTFDPASQVTSLFTHTPKPFKIVVASR